MSIKTELTPIYNRSFLHVKDNGKFSLFVLSENEAVKNASQLPLRTLLTDNAKFEYSFNYCFIWQTLSFTTQDQSSAEFKGGSFDFEGAFSFNVGGGNASIIMSPKNEGDNPPFDFGSGIYPAGIFNFITKDDNGNSIKNEGKFVFNGLTGGALVCAVMVAKKLISIDGIPATLADVQAIDTLGQGIIVRVASAASESLNVRGNP
ncbi:WD repeat-containing protein [Hafnia paralvei ATCC 29927]|uniref:hypothetical protein n=1 Tax=Hafnia paralvei TaxID=546367 RepID=UPI0007E43454|nr:hypothetical protein [Hafnia paralvei]OAT37927.1 WD repeat-containing protein [Hafnia paralvei ATCC 29927]